MKLFYTASHKELLKARNEIFLKRGIPKLNTLGFQKAPFSSCWFGRNNIKSYTYELCRLGEHSRLEIITTEITRGDNWIKIFLNIFEIQPELESIDQLSGIDGMQFWIPPNSISRMRLREDNYKLTPFFQIFFGKHHKIGPYFSKNDYEKQVRDLGNLIERDMANIDYFVKKWYEKHQPLITNWEGKKVN